MAFKTDAWFLGARDETAEPPPESLPGFDRSAAIERGKAEREALKIRLWDEGEIEFGNRLALCGELFPLMCTCCGTIRNSEIKCRKRWCPACAWLIARRRIDRFKGAIALMQWPAMITLTQQSSPDPETIRDIRKAFGRFRRRKVFAGQVAGGVAAIEITKGEAGYHPHIHAIIDCEWLTIHTPPPERDDSYEVRCQKMSHAQQELSGYWADVLGQEEAITWVTRCRNLDRLRYALKYCVKGSDLIEMDGPIGPLLRSLEKSRLISTFGNLYGRTAEMDGDERPVSVCQICEAESSYLPLDVIDAIIRRD